MVNGNKSLSTIFLLCTTALGIVLGSGEINANASIETSNDVDSGVINNSFDNADMFAQYAANAANAEIPNSSANSTNNEVASYSLTTDKSNAEQSASEKSKYEINYKDTTDNRPFYYENGVKVYGIKQTDEGSYYLTNTKAR